jgi:hypothetical protein
MDWTVSPPKSFIKVLTPNVMMVFIEMEVWEGNQIRWDYGGRFSTIIKRSTKDVGCSFCSYTWKHKEELMEAHTEMTATCKPGKKPTPGLSHTVTLILDFNL